MSTQSANTGHPGNRSSQQSIQAILKTGQVNTVSYPENRSDQQSQLIQAILKTGHDAGTVYMRFQANVVGLPNKLNSNCYKILW